DVFSARRGGGRPPLAWGRGERNPGNTVGTGKPWSAPLYDPFGVFLARLDLPRQDLFGVVTRHPMGTALGCTVQGTQFRAFGVAEFLLPPRAAGVETAARGRVRRRRQVTGEEDPLAGVLHLRVRDRDRRHERARV